ncbi:DUF5623 domain-containing protein [Aquipseudomonas campi]
MVTIATPPSTVDGIKRLAKSIKHAQKIPYQVALLEAARKAGFQNFVHAKRAIASSASRYSVFVTAYWEDRNLGPWNAGRETLEVILSRPLEDIISRRQIGRARNLRGFKWEADDHLEMVYDCTSQERAVEHLHGARATLHFLEATGLRPAYTTADYKAMSIASNIPGRDHESWWVDPATGEWVALDEPYSDGNEGMRYEWASNNGLRMAKPEWDGLYYPGQCVPSLFSPHAALLSRVVSQVGSLQKRHLAQGPLISDRYYSQFISPYRLARGTKRKPRPYPSYGERKGAVPYGGAPGVASDWRPAKAMPLELHMKVGPLLHQLCNSSFKATGLTIRIYDKINSVRSCLEDWAFIEHRDSITREVEASLYYGPGVDGYLSHQAALQALGSAINILRSGYEECKPRRDVLARLIAAEQDLAARKS